MESLAKVVVVDHGSQYTPVIERTLREIGYRSVVLPPKRADEWCKKYPVRAVILSGGPSSVYEEGAPEPPRGILELMLDGQSVPVLCICYGMQWVANHLGGKVESVQDAKGYGADEVRIVKDSMLFTGVGQSMHVWASHGDTVTRVPEGFSVSAISGGSIAAMENEEGTIYGVQFHPEVVDTPDGKRILRNFLDDIAGCRRDWEPGSMIEEIRSPLITEIGHNERVIFGFSGGVDSTALAALAAPVLRNRLTAVTIDGGQFRENELEEIRHHAHCVGVNLAVVDLCSEFDSVMQGTIDAEEKRRRFKGVYAGVFRKIAAETGASIIIQGTLAPDRIESGDLGGALIKSHHNVGLDLGNLQQAHPIDHLFKYEVRELARKLGLPDSICNRQPFPGPGGFIRVNGIPATQANLAIWCWAQARVEEILKHHGVYYTLSQVVVGLNGVKTVGVKGDDRVYGYSIVVRAVQTVDFMTARGVHFDEAIEDEIATVLTRHRDIVRVYFDPTNKPPGTTEFE